MRTKLLMMSSAVFLLALGALFSFAPHEVAGGSAGPLLVLVIQAAGALYLGFAILNWMARDNLIGGIYSKPVALGNFLHFAAFSAAVVKACAAGQCDARMLLVAGLYVVFAVWFGLVLFGSPVKRSEV